MRKIKDLEPNLVVILAKMLNFVEFAKIPRKTASQNGRRATKEGRDDR